MSEFNTTSKSHGVKVKTSESRNRAVKFVALRISIARCGLRSAKVGYPLSLLSPVNISAFNVSAKRSVRSYAVNQYFAILSGLSQRRIHGDIRSVPVILNTSSQLQMIRPLASGLGSGSSTSGSRLRAYRAAASDPPETEDMRSTEPSAPMSCNPSITAAPKTAAREPPPDSVSARISGPNGRAR